MWCIIMIMLQRLAIVKEFGDKATERRTYSNLGDAHIFLKEFDTAPHLYKWVHVSSHHHFIKAHDMTWPLTLRSMSMSNMKINFKSTYISFIIAETAYVYIGNI